MAVFFTRRGAPPSLEKKLSDYAEGDIIKIPENGAPVEFYVAKHDYESGLNGMGKTLVVRKDCYNEQQWYTDNMNVWEDSSILRWLNGTYIKLLDVNIQGSIGSTTYYYTPGYNTVTVKTKSNSIFLLSLTELGGFNTNANREGSSLPIANSLRNAYLNGRASSQWTRSPTTNNYRYAWTLSNMGVAKYQGCTSFEGVRPVFTLPSTAKFDSNTNIIIG